jgi:hypothetical protein
MSRAITRVMALVTTMASMLCSGAANAEPSSSPVAESGSGAGPEMQSLPVDVVLVGRAGTEGSLAERIRSWFPPGAPLSVKTEPELVAEHVLGRLPTRRIAVWVTLKKPAEARLYFAVTGETEEATRYLLRDVPLNDGFDEVGSERVAQVVHSSVTALIEGSVEVAERPEIERELLAPPAESELAKPAPAPPPQERAVPPKKRTESSSPSFAPLAGVSYRGAYAGDEGFAHGPGAALGATLRFAPFGAGLVARGAYVFPHTERFEDLDITIGGWSARFAARGEWLPSKSFALDLELGAGMYWARYDPEPTLAGPTPAERGVDPRFFEVVSAGLRGVVGPLWVGGRVELEVYPVQSQYELESAQKIGSNARFQPGLVFEVVFD